LIAAIEQDRAELLAAMMGRVDGNRDASGAPSVSRPTFRDGSSGPVVV
jgi:hypothetical protein